MAIPQAECNGMCSIDIGLHQCTEMAEMSCCDMMGMNNSQVPLCGIEFTENSCDFKYESIEALTFIIPKSVDSKVELVQISNIDIDFGKSISNLVVFSQSTITDVSPPIYISISSFLI